MTDEAASPPTWNSVLLQTSTVSLGFPSGVSGFCLSRSGHSPDFFSRVRILAFPDGGIAAFLIECLAFLQPLALLCANTGVRR